MTLQKQKQPLDKAMDTVAETTKAVIGTGVLLTGMGAVSGMLGGIKL